jgi:hypothetical protein
LLDDKSEKASSFVAFCFGEHVESPADIGIDLGLEEHFFGGAGQGGE